MSLGPRHLLLVEDDDHLRRILGRALQARGYEVHEAPSFEAAVERLLGLRSLTAAILDLRLPDGSGLDLLPMIKRHSGGARVVLMSGWGSIATALAAIRGGAVDFVSKPVVVDDLLEALEGTPEEPEGPTAGGETGDAEEETTVPSLNRVEWEHIQRVLANCDGNISQAARLLGIHRRSLQRKLAKRPPTR